MPALLHLVKSQQYKIFNENYRDIMLERTLPYLVDAVLLPHHLKNMNISHDTICIRVCRWQGVFVLKFSVTQFFVCFIKLI